MRWGVLRRLWAASLLVAMFCVAPGAHAFRTASDLEEFTGSGPIAFEGRVKLECSKRLPSTIDEANFKRALASAIGVWSSPTCASLPLKFDGFAEDHAVSGDGHNTIEWVDDWEERGFDGTRAGNTEVIFERDKTRHWHIVEADIYLNASLSWFARGDGETPSEQPDVLADAMDLEVVLTHELGHALGLRHVCDDGGADEAPSCTSADEASCMYPLYKPSQNSLSADDAAGVCFLYPLLSCADGCPGSQVCTKDGCANPDLIEDDDKSCMSDEGCAAGETCAGGACRGSRSRDDCEGGADCGDESSPQCGSESSCAPQAGMFGGHCEKPSDCPGNVCLAVDDDAPVCSQRCAAQEPACPAGWHCRDADGERVCAPPRNVADGGCAIATRVEPGTFSEAGLLAICLALIGRRTLRRASLSQFSNRTPCGKRS